jgi:hypothetical protein
MIHNVPQKDGVVIVPRSECLAIWAEGECAHATTLMALHHPGSTMPEIPIEEFVATQGIIQGHSKPAHITAQRHGSSLAQSRTKPHLAQHMSALDVND